MTDLTRSRRRRWAAPVAVVAAVAVVTATAQLSAVADDHPLLPARTAAELLVAVGASHPKAISGVVRSTMSLGLPSLPAMDRAPSGPGLTTVLSLATGTHIADVWSDGPEHQRLGLHGDFTETEVVHNGGDVWTYDSRANAVTHATAGAHTNAAARASAPAAPVTPADSPPEMAAAALAAIDPSTAVTVDSTARVAGRAAYRIVLTPRDDRSLIGSVRIALDAETSVPLQVQVFARGAEKAAIDVGFTRVSFAAISPSVFAFTPPAGAIVTEATAGEKRADSPGASTGERGRTGAGSAAAGAAPTVLGSGWTAVGVATLPAGALSASAGRHESSASDLIDRMTTPVAGGRLITTSLLTVLLSDDGRVFVGAVAPADLQKVAASGHGL